MNKILTKIKKTALRLFDRDFTVRELSFVLSLGGILVSLILFQPLRMTFNGDYKLNQKLDLAENFKIDSSSLNTLTKTVGFDIGDLWQFGQISIRYYALMIIIGIILGYFLSLYLSNKHHISHTVIDRLMIGLIVFGIIGARLGFMVEHINLFVKNPADIIIGLSSGGMSLFGGLAFGTIYLTFYAYRFQFKLLELLDIFAPSSLVVIIFTRFGNFFNYEGFGPSTTVFWKMYVPEIANYFEPDQRFFHPTFLYESIACFLLLILILWNFNDLTKRKIGLVTSSTLMGYGTVRAFIEPFKLDATKFYFADFLRIFGTKEITNQTLNIGIFSFEYLLINQLIAIILIIIGYRMYLNRHKFIYFKKDMSEIRVAN